MTRKPSKSGFTKLIASDATLLSADPLIGLLELETDTGQIELAMNRLVAERLMSTLVEFLQAGKSAESTRYGCDMGGAPGWMCLGSFESGLVGTA
jgi:hypothetical protein